MAASKSSSLPPAIFLMGPTASGKTALAMELCQRLPCEIISVDSALVYRGLDVGSAKPTREEQQRYPHRLIDIRDPADIYSAADFYSDALREMAAIVRAGRIPLLVGGTMLYFKALLEGLAQMPAADAEVRAGIEHDAARFGWAYIHGLLQEVDPLSASTIHPNHSQRLCRAYEVYLITGRPMSYWREQQQRHVLPYRVAQIAIAPREREVLHERIAQRFRLMMEQGLVDEVRALRRRQDLHPDLPAMRAVGYRQVWQYLDGEYSLEECVDKGIAATRQLAKRQLTWLRSWPDLMWLHTDSAGVVVANDDSPSGQGVSESKPVDAALKYLSATLGFDS